MIVRMKMKKVRMKMKKVTKNDGSVVIRYVVRYCSTRLCKACTTLIAATQTSIAPETKPITKHITKPAPLPAGHIAQVT